MANIIDYVLWRGDLTFKDSAFNNIDGLILSQLSYMLFDNIDTSMTLRNAAAYIFSTKQKATEGLLVSKEDSRLLSLLAKSRRFGQMMLSEYVNKIDFDEEKQFAAITIYPGDGTAFVSFRGTDDTLVGWKEDFNMSFTCPVPSQIEALEYLKNVSKHFFGKLRVGGHSKGGNLAVYAATSCGKRIQKRIIDIYNNDGPGLQTSLLNDEKYLNIREKVHTYVPQSSVVGMLLGHEEDYWVVHSTQTGLFQHDPYSWKVLGTDFEYLNEVTRESKFMDMTIKEWIVGMEEDQRKQFVDTLYEVISVTNAKTLLELSLNQHKSIVTVLKTMSNLDTNTRKMISKTFSQLLKIAKKNISIIKLQEKKNNE